MRDRASNRDHKPQLEPLPFDPILQTRQAELSEKAKRRLQITPQGQRFYITKRGIANRTKVFESIQRSPKQLRDIISDIGLTSAQTRYALKQLKKDGMIKCPGNGYLGVWGVVQP